MFREAAESASLAARQLDLNRDVMERLGETLRARRPRAVVTLARGSSDNAATYARYLIETRLGVMTASAAPSVSSLYAARIDLEGVLCLAISQSGRSPDLLAAVAAARAAGALVVVLVNAEGSPLEALGHWVAPLRAGPELSVAATKSFILALTAVAQMVACWARDETLATGLMRLPGQLRRAWALDWSPAAERLALATNLYAIGRGVGLGVAQEAALKFKETCGLHAEAFSAAEVRHGPMALVGAGFPALLFSQGDESRPGLEALASDFAGGGAEVIIAGSSDAAPAAPGILRLPMIDAHPDLEPILLAQSLYRMINALALSRGHDPDRPRSLQKVTETL
jgi:glucosamine--fructose-6-phosphate aminotransferase (isomerizing)